MQIFGNLLGWVLVPVQRMSVRFRPIDEDPPLEGGFFFGLCCFDQRAHVYTDDPTVGVDSLATDPFGEGHRVASRHALMRWVRVHSISSRANRAPDQSRCSIAHDSHHWTMGRS